MREKNLSMLGVKKAWAAGHGLIRDYLEVLVVIAIVTIGGWFIPVSYRVFGQIYLLAVIALSLRVSRWPVLAAALVSGLAWNFVFIPPRLSFSVLNFDDCLLLMTYFVVAVVGIWIAKLRSGAEKAQLLADSERMHQTLLDCVSHELKTPIAVFRSAAEHLDTDDRVKRRQVVVEIKMAAQRLDDLVGNLLNQTRLESGVLKPLLDWCDARDLVASACRALGDRLSGRPLSVDIPSELPLFHADAALMEQSISQLLLNAAVHTASCVPVRVTAGSTEQPARVFISVTDEGPGIPPDLQGRVFDKFSRGPEARAGGLGLGLSIVRGFMVAQGGDISLDTPPKGGARFTLFLPLETPGAVPIS